MRSKLQRRHARSGCAMGHVLFNNTGFRVGLRKFVERELLPRVKAWKMQAASRDLCCKNSDGAV